MAWLYYAVRWNCELHSHRFLTCRLAIFSLALSCWNLVNRHYELLKLMLTWRKYFTFLKAEFLFSTYIFLRPFAYSYGLNLLQNLDALNKERRSMQRRKIRKLGIVKKKRWLSYFYVFWSTFFLFATQDKSQSVEFLDGYVTCRVNRSYSLPMALLRYDTTNAYSILHGYRRNHLAFADGIDLFANTRDSLIQMSANQLNIVAKAAGLKTHKENI